MLGNVPANLLTPSPPDDKKTKKFLIQHCNTLYENAKKSHPKELLRKLKNYYLGDMSSYKQNNLHNACNIIKAIVDTKVALTVDAKMWTNVSPKSGPYSTMEEIEAINGIADVLDACKSHVFRINKMDSFQKKAIRDADIQGIAIAKVVWDQTRDNGLGDVSINLVDPLNFFPDPNSARIADCNYITIKNQYSSIDLKKRYPNMIKEIDGLAKSSNENSTSEYKNPKGLQTLSTNSGAMQTYVFSNTSGMQNLQNNIDVYETYFKDDSTFTENEGDTEEVREKNREQKFKYPFGRVIIWAGKDVVFEDKPLPNGFGFPFFVLNITETDKIWGQGDVEPLTYVQDRLNRAYDRVRSLIGQYVSLLLIDARLGISNEQEIVNSITKTVDVGSLSGVPFTLITNNTLGELGTLDSYIERLKKDARDIARVSEMMISGERQRGVNSGEMVEALNESPMASIRDMQGQLEQFLIDITTYTIKLIQLFYRTPRLIRLAEGKRYLQITPIQDESLGVNPATIQEVELTKNEIGQTIKQVVNSIQGDLSITEFEAEVTAGSKSPRTRAANAQLTFELYKTGVFGSPDSIEAKAILLNNIDYENDRAIIQQLEIMKRKQDSQPLPPPELKVSANFKDMPVKAQDAMLNAWGLPGHSEADAVKMLLENSLLNQSGNISKNIVD